jgi:hypothetical protein
MLMHQKQLMISGMGMDVTAVVIARCKYQQPAQTFKNKLKLKGVKTG